MKNGMPIITLALLLFFVAQASAQPLPMWKTSELCHGEGDRAACAEFESRAYREVAGPWPTFAPEIRTACLAQMDRDEPKSYRTLKSCLETQVFEEHISAHKKRTAE